MGVFGGRRKHRDEIIALQEQNANLQAELHRVGALDLLQRQQELANLTKQISQQRARFERDRDEFNTQYAIQRHQLAKLSAEVVQTSDAAVMQDAGVYFYRHVLADAEGYKQRLAAIRQQMQTMIKRKTAVRGSESFHYNNSLAHGRRFVADLSKLMLRAYNAEADVCVRVLKAGNLDSAVSRLETSVRVTAKLGAMAAIRINPEYHALRVLELELTADYLAKKQQEREAERERKAQLREERLAMKEYLREQERLRKEQQHYRNAIAALRGGADPAELAELEAKLADIGEALEGVRERAANIRAGYVYVISNVGAFGDNVVKIGMTRRLDPMDRVRELGDASVPFRFDVHALFFAQDAVGIENELHRRLGDRRVNKVNLRREFFRASPAEVKALLHELAGSLLDYTDAAEAPEYRQSSPSMRVA
ncbi:hypothetical protein BAY61_15800 [Prauserella marina]|uniref:T5orf172 domain-containing protein n=1 Tax=Prauserella marina TaxID=530584 RepID=A0A222VQL6_9PSEU|nr:DUF4041 domain-containing protein [Prauserella marina]ASR36226.1 hypothetical protein BAY61_15800 [Prauserella marina]PWV76989.1 T5orf172 domain-containing protein [Prauserella marina]SDD01843.1 T5orf172 domain-containing protein [Prauserella marina]